MNNLRKRIEQGFEAFGHLIYRRRWLALLLVVAVTAIPLSQLPHTRMDTSTEGFLFEDDPTLLAYNAFRDQFGHDQLSVVAVTAPATVFEPAFLEKLRALHEALATRVPHLDDINSLINARNTRGAENALIVEDLMESWPKNAEELEAKRQRAMGNPLYRNLLLSEDGRITAIVLKGRALSEQGGSMEDVLAGFEEPTAGEGVQRNRYLTPEENSEIARAVLEVAAEFDAPDFDVQVAGPPVVEDVLKAAVQENVKRFMGLALLTIAILLFIMFRRVSGVLLPFAVVILSVLATVGLMALFRAPIKLPTQILPSFLLAVGVGAAVHLLAIFFRNYRQKGDKEHALADTLGHSGLPIVMTSLTTAAGLASFAGAELAPTADLGLFSAAGVLLSLFYTLVLLPALIAIFPLKAVSAGGAQQRHAAMDRLLVGIADVSTGHPKTILLISAAVLLFGLAGAAQVRFSHKPVEWLPQEMPVRQANDYLDQRMGGTSSVEVVIDTGRENGLYEPKVLAALDTLGAEVSRIERGDLFVGKTLSLADMLKEIHKALNEDQEAFYAIPTDRDLIAQEFLLFENSGSDDLEDFVDSGFTKARFTAKTPWMEATLYTGLIDDLQQRFRQAFGEGAQVTITGIIALLSRTIHTAMITTAESYAIAAVVISLMMILLIGNVRIGLVAMLPNLTPIILTLGIMGWWGLPLDMFTMLIGSIAIGLAVDDTIHFMHNYRRYHRELGDVRESVRQTLLTSGRAMLVTTVVLSTGFFSYMASVLNNVFNFGLLTGFTILTALLADFFLAPALMAQMHRSHLLPKGSDY